MKTFGLEKNGRLKVLVGTSVTQAITDALWLARAKKYPIQFTHNGVIVIVESDSNPELLFRDWRRALLGFIKKEVGPYPKPKLTKKDRAQDALLKARKGDYQVQKSRLVAALESPRAGAHSVSP